MNEKLIQVFHEAQERLQAGESLESVLRAYPEDASDLAEMLQITQAIPKARANHAEFSAARSRLDMQFEKNLGELKLEKKSLRFPRMTLAVAVSFALIFMAVFLFFPRSTTNNAVEITLTQAFIVSETLAAESPSPTSTTTATVTTSASATTSPTASETKAAESPEVTTNAACQIPEGWLVYIVKSGDTFSDIAVNSGTSLDSLMQGNCIQNASTLLIGQRIYVPRLWNTEEEQDREEDSQLDESNSGQSESNGGSSDDSDDDDEEEDDESEDD